MRSTSTTKGQGLRRPGNLHAVTPQFDRRVTTCPVAPHTRGNGVILIRVTLQPEIGAADMGDAPAMVDRMMLRLRRRFPLLTGQRIWVNGPGSPDYCYGLIPSPQPPQTQCEHLDLSIQAAFLILETCHRRLKPVEVGGKNRSDVRERVAGYARPSRGNCRPATRSTNPNGLARISPAASRP